MNILIILGNDKNEKTLEERYGVLLEHARYWAQDGNEVFIFGIKILDKWKDAGFHFVKSPGRIPSNLRAYIWFLTDTHPRVDIVIQSVGVFNFSFKKTATVLYLPLKTKIRRYRRLIERMKKGLIFLILRLFFKNSDFLVSEYNQKKSLLSSKIDKNNIFLLKRGVPLKFRKRSLKRRDFGKTILFSGRNRGFSELLLVIELFKLIDRRREGWKFTLLVERNLLKKTRSIIQKSEFQSRINAWEYNIRNSLIREISRSDFFLDITLERDSLYNDLLSMNSGAIVVLARSAILEEYPGIEKSSIVVEKKDPQEIANAIIGLENNELERERYIKEGYFFAENYFWDKLAGESYQFLGKVRPD